MKAIKAEDTRSLEPFRDRIIEGDCLEVMKGIPGESIDMILCDLPYGTTQNKWDSIINLDLLFTEYMRIIKPHGAIVLTSSGLFTAKLMLHAPEIYKYKLIWVKSKATNFLNAKKQPLRKYEDICVFYKAQPTYNPQMSEGEAYDKGVLSSALRKTKMLLCLRSGPSITSTYAINVLKRPSEPLRRNSRQLAKTSYFTYPYIVACGLKNFRDFKSKRNVDLFVILSALRLDLRCLRSGEKRFVKHLLGELLLSLRYL